MYLSRRIAFHNFFHVIRRLITSEYLRYAAAVVIDDGAAWRMVDVAVVDYRLEIVSG